MNDLAIKMPQTDLSLVKDHCHSDDWMSKRGGKCDACGKEYQYPSPLKLDIGCGKNKKEGYLGVDTIGFEGVDFVLDLVAKDYRSPNGGIAYPAKGHLYKAWLWETETVDEVHCSHFLEHLTGAERIHFFNELHRVMKKDAKALIVVPHWRSGRAYGDPTHQWPPVVEMSWYYLDKNWRKDNAPHVGFECDFLATWGYSIAPHWQARSQDSQTFGLQHYCEVAQDMIATLTKR